MIKYYITAGFMGSGSSAITDLLSEFKDVSAPNGDFEYVFLHAPDGVFDLEDKLLLGNTALRSDEAIHSFLKFMEDLYKKKHFWVANYKKRVSVDFDKYTYEFIEDLNPVRLGKKTDYWYYMQNPSRTMTFFRFLRKVLYLVSCKQILTSPPLRYHGMILAYPSREEFYKAAHKYIYSVMNDIKGNNKAIVLDQFLLPHNFFRIDNYFDDDVCIILVDRDPRDVFISNKYYWALQRVSVPFPTEVNEFCLAYKKMRESVKQTDSNKIIRVQFEDLIYQYDDMVNELCLKLHLEPGDHVDKRRFFNPDISIVNTNLQRKNATYKEETKIIEQKLPEYIYDFPNDELVNRSEFDVF